MSNQDTFRDGFLARSLARRNNLKPRPRLEFCFAALDWNIAR